MSFHHVINIFYIIQRCVVVAPKDICNPVNDMSNPKLLNSRRTSGTSTFEYGSDFVLIVHVLIHTLCKVMYLPIMVQLALSLHGIPVLSRHRRYRRDSTRSGNVLIPLIRFLKQNILWNEFSIFKTLTTYFCIITVITIKYIRLELDRTRICSEQIKSDEDTSLNIIHNFWLFKLH